MRSTDSKRKTYFRSGRFFICNSKWYFQTREGIDCGPFKTALDAEAYLKKFLWINSHRTAETLGSEQKKFTQNSVNLCSVK